MVASFDAKIADVEYSLFKDHHILVSDEDARALMSSPQQFAQYAFDLLAFDQGPTFKPVDVCRVESPSLPTLPQQVALVMCDYTTDDDQVSTQEYRILQDAVTGALYYGDW